MSASAAQGDKPADRTVVITRTLDAPARLVFLAMSKPEHVMKWFGPVGWPLTMCEMDFRVGGKFCFAMTGSSGVQNMPFGGTYREIVKDRRIVYDNGFEIAGAGRMVVTINLDEKDGKTTLTMSTLFDTQAMYNEHVGMGFVQGTNSGFDQLVDVVAALRHAEG
ncbi:MAG: ATPase [Reyranella sp.]|nr:ATPase [Reyranella sp.]